MEDAVMVRRTNLIQSLATRQSLTIMQHMSAILADRRIDQQDIDPGEQAAVLNAAFQEAGYPSIPVHIEDATHEQAGRAAQQFLILLAETGDDEILSELDEWLEEPPQAEIAAIPLVLALPVVLTACIIALQTQVRIERDPSGGFVFSFVKAPTSDEIVGKLFGVVKGTVGT